MQELSTEEEEVTGISDNNKKIIIREEHLFLLFSFINKDTMIISKCVPLSISRKMFSQFENGIPKDMVFVGYKTDDNGKKINAKVDFESIAKEVIGKINAQDDINEVKFHDVKQGSGPYWNEELQLHIVDLDYHLGAIEINSGGNYVEENFYLINPVFGTVTNIVVDNTGLPLEGDLYEPAVSNFHLYYGNKGNEIIVVPPNHRGIVQILHTKDTDVVISSTLSEASDMNNPYTPDQEYDEDDDLSGLTNQVFPDENFDVDMNNEKAFMEFIPTGDKSTYTFWFKNPEFGSTTYIVINNQGENYIKDVDIWYGKRHDKSDTTDDISNLITNVSNELCVIEVFHSLSADIIVKVTKV